MATRKSGGSDGGDDASAKADPSVDAPPDLSSDPIEPRDAADPAPGPSDEERRTLDTFAAEPTPDAMSERAAEPNADAGSERAPDGPSPWGSASPAAPRASDFALDAGRSGDVKTDDVKTDDADAKAGAARKRDFGAGGRGTAAAGGAAPAQSEPATVTPSAAAAPPKAKKRSSFAGWTLTFLILLIAGAALAIWAAPRLVPLLPAGMEPVARWLEPGRAEAEARIAALEGSIDELSAQVAAAPTADALEAQAQSLVDAARTDLGSRIDEIRATLEQTDFTEANERIGRLETTINGVSTELTTLKDQIAASTTSDTAAASIDTYRAELDGLRAEVNTLSGSVSGFSAKLQQAIADAEARTTAAEARAADVEQAAVAERDLAAAQADVAAIRAALANGGPFAAPLEGLRANADVTPPEGLAAAAETGVATPAELRAQFSDQAHEAIQASVFAEAGDGLLARSRAFLASNVASRSLEPQEGDTSDAVLSRIEDALRRDDLTAALAEAERLPPEAAAALDDWIEAARRRADAEAGLEEVSASVSAMN